eukprot:COSAG02_NODE_731_length_17977_cov_21.672838_18_plen_74_part_00
MRNSWVSSGSNGGIYLRGWRRFSIQYAQVPIQKKKIFKILKTSIQTSSENVAEAPVIHIPYSQSPAGDLRVKL